MKADAAMQLDVLAELQWEPAINAAQIGVMVEDGTVTLAGHVASYSQKWDAERAARRVNGVQAVRVDIDVKLEKANEREDGDIARSAEQVLAWTTHAPRDSIRIEVEDGWIVLTGTVDWEYQRKGITDSLRHLIGVTGVTDRILLNPTLSPEVVQRDIEAALKRRASSDTHQISVKVDGSSVTLAGHVHSWSERELATHSAWSTPGVRNVIDNLTIG